MNNYNLSNSSVQPSSTKATRYYGLPVQKHSQQSPSSPSEGSKGGKMQVLKAIPNFRKDLNKVIGIDMSQEEYFFYKPILGLRRLSNKANEQGPIQGTSSPVNTRKAIDLTAKENSTHSINVNHHFPASAQSSPKGMFNNSKGFQAHKIKDPSHGALAQRQAQDESYKKYLEERHSKLQKENLDEATMKATLLHKLSPSTRQVNNEREHVLAQGRPSLRAKEVYNSQANEDSTDQRPSLTGILAYENHKQFSNNPLKDISNQMVNSSNINHDSQTNSKPNGRYSMMPFEIAPKAVKINNFIDQMPFKSPDSVKMATLEVSSPNLRLHSGKEPESSNRNSFGQKVSGFEDQHKGGKSGKFEKKRLSDNVLKVDDRYKIEDDVIREIYDRKEKNVRKGHNVSVTTNTSTNSVATTIKKSGSNFHSNLSQNSHQQPQRKSTGSKNPSVVSDKSEIYSSPAHAQQTLVKIQNQEKLIGDVMDQIKRKCKPTFNLNDASKGVKDLTNFVSSSLQDNTLLFLVRQHSRTEFVTMAFVKVLEEELMGGAKSNDSIQAILLNALDYTKKSLKCFAEIIQQMQKSNKGSKKDLNANPFGVGGAQPSTRNSSNKENYGGNTNSTKNVSSKSEKKMFIKQNIQIAIAFLKKICRINKMYQERFKELLAVLNIIESGQQTSKVKEQIKKAIQAIRGESGNSTSRFNTSSHNTSVISSHRGGMNAPSRKHKRRESMTIDIDDEPSNPFDGFGELKEQDNEESTEENQTITIPNNNQDVTKAPVAEKKPVLFGNENSNHLNYIESGPGRLSLQPQPIGGFKLSSPPTPTSELKPEIDSENQPPKKDKELSHSTTSQPQISIVTRKHGTKISNTHEPITVRGQRNNLRLEVSDDNVQYCLAPAHINVRSNSQPQKEPCLPADISRGLEYTLVLDLDETLVHFDPKIRTYRPRPGALKFLNEMAKYYELCVFTAGLKDYADWILNDFDRTGYITHRLYRDSTKCKNGVYIKDLAKLGRDMSKIIIIDNIEENFQAQPDNGIPIKGWYHCPNDRELEKLTPFLRSLVQRRVKDVRTELRRFKEQLTIQQYGRHHAGAVGNSNHLTNQYIQPYQKEWGV